jgi:hypothetical protein
MRTNFDVSRIALRSTMALRKARPVSPKSNKTFLRPVGRLRYYGPPKNTRRGGRR